MAKNPIDELHEAYQRFARVSDECAASADYNAFVDLLTDDCTSIEHHRDLTSTDGRIGRRDNEVTTGTRCSPNPARRARNQSQR